MPEDVTAARRPACSVVVPTHRRPELLARCLETLRGLDHGDYEVIVVDNTKGDDSTRAVAEAAGARIVLEPRPGVSRARNTGAIAARGDVVAFTDDDVVVDARWLRAHQQTLDADPDIAASAGRVLPWPPRIADEWDYHDEDLGERGFRIDGTQADWFERTNFGGFGIGPNMALRRSLFADGWGFHPALGAARGLPGEEHYAWYQLVRAGYVLAYSPGAIIYHEAPESPAAVDRRRRSILRGSAAYALAMIIHDRDARRDVLRFVVNSVGGRRNAWRERPGSARPRRFVACLLAPTDYIIWRWRFRGVGSPPAPAGARALPRSSPPR